GLPLGDARRAHELAKADLEEVTVDGQPCSCVPVGRRAGEPAVHLLPPYDEYTVAYRDRSAAGTPPTNATTFGESTLLGPNIVVDGIVVGTWRRDRTKIAAKLWSKLPPKDASAVEKAIARYADFVST
ncbi:MAG TPA: crosslink repair DNA glycosylase YcaQ family protein, partial [Kofleriaceae bacterium]|nr:crosslink repair DNA glycosylase YcaQ family protein [Kofleriaceae bacterium]